MNEIVIADPQTVRKLNSIQTADSAGFNAGEDSLRLLTADPDDIFGEAFTAGYESGKNETEETGFSADMLENYLKETPKNGHLPETGGDWNFIILRLKKGISAGAFIQAFNKKIHPYGLTAVKTPRFFRCWFRSCIIPDCFWYALRESLW